MYKTIKIGGKRHRINAARFEAFCTVVTVGIFTAAVIVFFFGCCWGGFLRG